jgi:hypothetical protein
MVLVTGTGDHDRPDWLIRINGIRNEMLARPCRMSRSGPERRWMVQDQVSLGRF